MVSPLLKTSNMKCDTSELFCLNYFVLYFLITSLLSYPIIIRYVLIVLQQLHLNIFCLLSLHEMLGQCKSESALKIVFSL